MQVIGAAGRGWVAAQASAGFSAQYFALNLWTDERVYSPTREDAKRLAVKLAKRDGPQQQVSEKEMAAIMRELAHRLRTSPALKPTS